jgi:hypothetical protein
MGIEHIEERAWRLILLRIQGSTRGGEIVNSFGKSSVSCHYTLGAGGCDWKMTFAGVGRLEAARERDGLLTIMNEIFNNTEALWK